MISTSQDCHLPVLDQFARTVWGNSQAVLKQHPDGFEFIDLGGYFTAFHSFFAGMLKHDKLLVRDEYRVASQALEADTYKVGAYVTGQPGIGKTLFLVYLLVLCLGQKQPVAVQFLDGKEFYALFKDSTVGFHSLNDSTPLYECPSVWALCDSNSDVKSPDSIFKGHQGIRIIQTTPPNASCWKGWSKQVGAEPYVMDICPDEEVAMLLGLDVHRTKTLAEKWGNVPRLLVRYMDKEDWAIETLYRQGAREAVRESQIMMDQGTQLNFPNEDLSRFCFLQPMKTPTGAICRELAYLGVPTQTLRSILAKALQGQDNLMKLQFYDALSYQSKYSFFIVDKKINCQWVVQGSGNAIVQFPTTSTTAGVDLIPVTKNAPVSAMPPYYWVPSKTNFPGIDSVLVLEDGIFAFQVIMNSGHSTSPIDSLKCLRKMLPRNLKTLPWRMVFVGPEEGPLKVVARHWNGQLFFKTKRKSMPVGWSAVDPVQYGVTYREHHDESDPAPMEPEGSSKASEELSMESSMEVAE